MALQAVKEGKHVHCEKPFCRFTGEGLQVCRAAAKAGVRVAVGETYVFTTAHQRARALIEEGEIGRPLQIRQRHGDWIERAKPRINTGPIDRSWRVDAAKSGGGAYPWIFDHAVHFFAAAEYFALDEPIAEVYAVRAQRAGIEQQSGAAHDPYQKNRGRYSDHYLEISGRGGAGCVDAGRAIEWKIRLYSITNF